MHLKEAELRAYLDQEAGPAQRQSVEAHLASCADCRERSAALQSRSQRIAQSLASLEPGEAPPVRNIGAARARFEARRLQSEKERESMFAKFFNRLSRPAWVALTILALLAASLAFPPVRAIANSFLGLFRVQQVRVIQINPNDLPEQLGDSTQFELMLSEDVQVENYGEPQDVASAAEASQATGFSVRLPASLQGKEKLTVQPGGQANFSVDLPRVQALLDEIGRTDIQLPAALDGAQVSLEVANGVTAQYGNCEFKEGASQPVFDPDKQDVPFLPGCTVLVQMPSPSISAPPGLDIAGIGQAYLQIMGMSPEEAASFANNVDWTTTLVVPIPRYGTQSETVPVDGVSGTLIRQHLENPPERYMLLWVKDGILYALTGSGDGSAGLEIANSLQ